MKEYLPDKYYKAAGYLPIIKRNNENVKEKIIRDIIADVTIITDEGYFVFNESLRETIDFKDNSHVILYCKNKRIIFDFVNENNVEGALKINKKGNVIYIRLGFSLPEEVKGRHKLFKEEVVLRRDLEYIPTNYRDAMAPYGISGGQAGGFAEKHLGEKWVLELPVSLRMN